MQDMPTLGKSRRRGPAPIVIAVLLLLVVVLIIMPKGIAGLLQRKLKVT